MRANHIMKNLTTKTWADTCKKIISEGSRVGPRGTDTLEILGNQTIVDMNDPFNYSMVRELDFAFAFAEAYWITSGRNDLEWLEKFAPSYGRFSDNGHILHGAYGPLIQQQLNCVVSALSCDTDTRQAVLTIWKPNPYSSKDIPCTIAMQFIIRNNTLHSIVTMRSSDMWLGWSYDIISFSAVAELIRLHVDSELKLGNLYLNAGSQHLYQKNIEYIKPRIANLEAFDTRIKSNREVLNWDRTTCPKDFVQKLRGRASWFIE